MGSIKVPAAVMYAHKIANYANDLSMSHSGKNTSMVIANFEEDAKGILKFMALNGFVANPSKTEFMLINKEKEPNKNLHQKSE